MTKKSISRLLQASLMCCLAVLFTACDDIFASEDNPIPAYLSMSDKPVTIKVGDTYRRKAISVTTAVVEYTSSDTKVATVDGEGVVTAIAEGEATITATATGYSSQNGKKIYQPASVSYVVTVTPAAIATITTPPVATTGDIAAGSETALVTAGVADGGTMMYEVTTTNTKPATTEGFGATIPTAANLGVGTYYVWYYAKGNTGYNDSEIAASAVEVTIVPTLSTPLTLEALTAGTIIVTSPKAGMQYSLNGGAKTAVPDGTPIDVAVGDKVAFYGNGISITSYFNGTTSTTIKGGTAEVKVYGNIMSLVDEENFATNKMLPAYNTFACLFQNYTTLKDASDLLLPATTLTDACYNGMFGGCTSLTTAPAELPAMTMTSVCYAGMFAGCTSLTTAPKLPATTLAMGCYYVMFSGCTSLTTAYVKAAYTTLNVECEQMFAGCSNLSTCTLYTDGDWSSYTAISNWQKAAYPTE